MDFGATVYVYQIHIFVHGLHLCMYKTDNSESSKHSNGLNIDDRNWKWTVNSLRVT